MSFMNLNSLKSLTTIIILYITIYSSLKLGYMMGEDKCYGSNILSNITLINERDMAVAVSESLYAEVGVYKNGKMNDYVNILIEENERLNERLKEN